MKKLVSTIGSTGTILLALAAADPAFAGATVVVPGPALGAGAPALAAIAGAYWLIRRYRRG